jgi:hypothetical protein
MSAKRTTKKTAGKRSAKKVSAKRTAKKSVAKRTPRKATSKRTLIAPKGNKRYVRRNKKGQFNEVDDVGKSLSADRRKKAKTRIKAGQGDRGDR